MVYPSSKGQYHIPVVDGISPVLGWFPFSQLECLRGQKHIYEPHLRFLVAPQWHLVGPLCFSVQIHKNHRNHRSCRLLQFFTISLSYPYEQVPKPSKTHENPIDTVPACRCTCVHDLQVRAKKVFAARTITPFWGMSNQYCSKHNAKRHQLFTHDWT